jgi:hypothetical protein
MSTAADAAADESFSRIAWRRAAESLQLLQTACAAAAEAAQSAREDVIDGCVSCMKRRGVSSEAVIDLESLIDGSTQRSCAPGETSTSSPSELLVHRWMSYTLAPALSIALLVTSGWTGLIVLVVIVALALGDVTWLSGAAAKAVDRIGAQFSSRYLRRFVSAEAEFLSAFHAGGAREPTAAEMEVNRLVDDLSRQKQKHVQHLTQVGIKRLQNQQLARSWAGWHAMWLVATRQRLILRTANWLNKIKLARSYSMWKQDWAIAFVSTRAIDRAMKKLKVETEMRRKEASTQTLLSMLRISTRSTQTRVEKRKPEDSVLEKKTASLESRLEATTERYGQSPHRSVSPLPIWNPLPASTVRGQCVEAEAQTLLTGPSPYSGVYPPRSWKPPSKPTREFACQTSSLHIKRKPPQPDAEINSREVGVQACLAAPKPPKLTLVSSKEGPQTKTIGCGPGPWQWTATGPQSTSTTLATWHATNQRLEVPGSVASPRLPKVTLVFCNARSAHTPSQKTPRRLMRSSTSIDALEPTHFFAPLPGTVHFYVRLRTTDPPILNGPGWREPLQSAKGYASKRSIIWPSATLDYERVIGRDPHVNLHLAGGLDLELCVPGDLHGLNQTLETSYHQLNLQTARLRSHLEDGSARISIPLMTRPRQGLEEVIAKLRAGPPPDYMEDGAKDGTPLNSSRVLTPLNSSRTTELSASCSPSSTPRSPSEAAPSASSTPTQPLIPSTSLSLRLSSGTRVPSLPLPAFLPLSPPTTYRPDRSATQQPTDQHAADDMAISDAPTEAAALAGVDVAAPAEAEAVAAEFAAEDAGALNTRIRALFDSIDTDGSFQISRKELAAKLRADGELEALLGFADATSIPQMVRVMRMLEDTGEIDQDVKSHITREEFETALLADRAEAAKEAAERAAGARIAADEAAVTATATL